MKYILFNFITYTIIFLVVVSGPYLLYQFNKKMIFKIALIIITSIYILLIFMLFILTISYLIDPEYYRHI